MKKIYDFKLTKEQQQLVEDNHNLIYSYLNKRHLPIDSTFDFYGDAALGLCTAAHIYNPSLGFKFLITNNGTYNYFVSNFMGGTNSPEVQYSFYLDNNTPFYNLTTSTISGNSIISELTFNDPLLQTYENINLNETIS